MEPNDRVIVGSLLKDEPSFDESLRPQKLEQFVGQPRLKKSLDIALRAAKSRNHSVDHTLLYGPPGLGKTTLAMIVAHESGRPLRMSSGPAIQHAGDLAAVLVAVAEEQERSRHKFRCNLGNQSNGDEGTPPRWVS